jgi:hypothetical protein
VWTKFHYCLEVDFVKSDWADGVDQESNSFDGFAIRSKTLREWAAMMAMILFSFQTATRDVARFVVDAVKTVRPTIVPVAHVVFQSHMLWQRSTGEQHQKAATKGNRPTAKATAALFLSSS